MRACSLSDLTFTLRPVCLFPSVRLAGGGTHGRIHVHLRFPPMKVLPAVSSRTTGWKSARLHGGVMFQPLSVPLSNGLRLLQLPLPAISTAHLAMSPASPTRRNVGFTMFDCHDMDDLAPAFTPAAVVVRVLQSYGWSTLAALPFGLSLSASLARCILRCPGQFTCVGPVIQPCPSNRIDARSRGDRLTAVASS